MILNQKTLGDLNTSFTALYNAGFATAANLSKDYLQLAMETTSTGADEAYGWLRDMPRMSEWLAERTIRNIAAEDFKIKNRKFESTVKVKADHIEDDNIGQYSQLFQALGAESARHPNELVFSLLANAFTTICYDGQYFIDTDHPVLDKDGKEISVSNSGGGSGSPWFLMDAKQVSKPLIFQKRRDYRFVALDNVTDQNVFMQDEFLYGVDCRVNAGFGLWQLAYGSKQTLDETNLELAQANLSGRLGDYGRPMRLDGNLLVVGPSNAAKAKRLVTAENNAAGATNIHRGTAEVLVVPELG